MYYYKSRDRQKEMKNRQYTLFLPQALVWEFARSLILFLIRYYSLGLRNRAIKAWDAILWYERLFALTLSLRTLFTPLYGDYSRSGRIVGIFLRTILLIGRTIGFVFMAIVTFAIFVLYGALPFIILYLLFNPNPDNVWQRFF